MLRPNSASMPEMAASMPSEHGNPVRSLSIGDENISKVWQARVQTCSPEDQSCGLERHACAVVGNHCSLSDQHYTVGDEHLSVVGQHSASHAHSCRVGAHLSTSNAYA